MTGSEGTKHTRRMLASGTQIVGGVNAAQGRQHGRVRRRRQLPVFGTVAEAMAETGADVSVVFVPPAFTKAAVDRGDRRRRSPLAVVITEGVPVHDTAEFFAYALANGHDPDHRPELPGHHPPGQSQRRHHPGRHHRAGPHRPGLQVGHADLPDDVRAARHRLLHRRRHRRRPDHRHHAHRRPRRRSRPTRRPTPSS